MHEVDIISEINDHPTKKILGGNNKKTQEAARRDPRGRGKGRTTRK